MSRVSNLCLLLIFICIKSLARVLELMILYWFSRCRWLLRIVFSFFAALYMGAVLLLTTGQMGVFGLCSFSRALSVGADGFFWVKYLICFLSIILSHFSNVLCMVLWFLCVWLFMSVQKFFLKGRYGPCQCNLVCI